MSKIIKNFSTAERLKYIMQIRNLKQADILSLANPFCIEYGVRLGRNDLSQYVSGKVEPRQNKLFILSKALNVPVTWLMGLDVPMDMRENTAPVKQELTPDEQAILDDYNKLNTDGKEKASDYVSDLTTIEKYTAPANSKSKFA